MYEHNDAKEGKGKACGLDTVVVNELDASMGSSKYDRMIRLFKHVRQLRKPESVEIRF